MRSLAQRRDRRRRAQPGHGVALLDNISNSLPKDQNLDCSDVKGLINAFRDLDPSSIEMLTVPVVGTMKGDAEVVVPKEPDAEPMLDRLRTFSGGRRPRCRSPCRPTRSRVQRLNGSSHPEWGDEVLDGLVAHGFHGVGPAEDAATGRDYPLTQIRWTGGRSGQGDHRRVAISAPATRSQARPDEIGGADVLVIVGNDWGDLVAPAKRPPDPNATTTDPADHGRTVAPTDTTTTVAPPPDAPARSRSETPHRWPARGCP